MQKPVQTPLQKAQALIDAPFEAGLLSPPSMLGDLYESAMSTDPRAASRAASRYVAYSPSVSTDHLGFFQGIRQSVYYSLIQRPAMNRAMEHMQKAVVMDSFEAQSRSMEAATQGNVVNSSLAMWGMYNNAQGVVEPTGITFQAERNFAANCEPLAAIIGKRVAQARMYSTRCLSREKHVQNPGFRIVLSNVAESPTTADLKRTAELEQYVEECGYTKPPVDERPMGWQPGFDNFIAQVMRDSLTLDWVPVRRWKDKSDPGKFPIVAFCAEDAGLIRRKVKEPVAIENGIVQFREYDQERTNTKKEIVLVKIDGDGSGRPLIEFTEDELFTAVRRPRTDELALGYGFSEIEECWNSATIWNNARDYNASRFQKDSLPRGILTILAQMNKQQQDAFSMNWQQMMQGLGKRWNTPILTGTPSTGSSVTWQPIDMSSRDMEYGQYLFTVGLWMHCIYQIHPDETGFSASSPFRPPLSEASPEDNLKYSQDTGFNPLMRWLAAFLNREILWIVEPSRRYKLEFVGLGDWNEEADVQMDSLKLQNGFKTPRMVWEEWNITMPKAILDHPASDFPAPFMTGFQAINALAQTMHAQDQQDSAMQQQTQQANAQQKMMQDNPQLAAGAGGGPGGPPGGGDPGGGPGGAPGADGPPMPQGMGAPGSGMGADASMGADDTGMPPGGAQAASPAAQGMPGQDGEEDDAGGDSGMQLRKAFLSRGSYRRHVSERYDTQPPPLPFVRGGKKFRR